MNFQEIATMISTVGFPIVMCGALFWKMNEQDKQHKEEMEHMTSALENNTVAIVKLTYAMGEGEADDKRD